MRRVVMHAVRIVSVLLIGGFLGATLVRLAPGYGTDEQELDSRLNRESLQAIRTASSNSQNLPAYYAHYLVDAAHGDFGYSRTLQQPVRQLLAERFPATLRSIALGLLLGWCLGLPLAIAPVMLRSWQLDLAASLLAGLLLCLPAAVLALLFVIGHMPGRLVIGLIVFPKIFRYVRNLLQQTATRPHIVTAWAKGLGSQRVLFRHILPVAAPQLFALVGVSISLAFAAAVPVEVICDLPGVGQLAWIAAQGRDLELLVNLTMIITLVTLVANSAADALSSGLRGGVA